MKKGPPGKGGPANFTTLQFSVFEGDVAVVIDQSVGRL